MKVWFNRFEWDEKYLTFYPAPVSWRTFLRKLPLWLGVQVLLSFLLVGIGYPLWESHFLAWEKQEARLLEEQEKSLARELEKAERRLAYLYERSSRLYRPVVGLEALPSSRWEGSMGGSPIHPIERVLYRAQLMAQEYAMLEGRLQEQFQHVLRLPCIAPIQGPIVSEFGFRRDPFHGHWQMHTGVDISAPYGAPVRATAGGRVRTAGWDAGGYGLQVEVDHQNGLITKYAHLSRIAVAAGDTVQRGQVIGYVGSTGYSVAPHLHYEVIEKGVKVNPRKYLLLF